MRTRSGQSPEKETPPFLAGAGVSKEAFQEQVAQTPRLGGWVGLLQSSPHSGQRPPGDAQRLRMGQQRESPGGPQASPPCSP